MMRKAISTILLCTSALFVSAQDSVLSKFLKHRNKAYQEKVFVHNDRNVYITGETMWFKVYYVDGSFHSPADVSRVVYVEIVDAGNNSVVREKVELKDGIAAGTLFIPATVNSGTYQLRAYTNWMKNFSPDYFFNKPVVIVNSFVKLEGKSSPAVANDIQFFPEGGNLLAGVVNKVGFKGISRSGKGLSFHGAVIDDNNDTLVRFKPLRFGMGSFEFTPGAGKKYRAILRFPGTNVVAITLPDATQEGYAMRVTESSESLTVEVSMQPLLQRGPAVSLLAHTRNQLVKSERKLVSQGKATFTIPLSDLKDGVSHITIFDDRLTPVAERLYFKAPSKSIQMTAQTDQPSYKKRSKVTLGLQTALAVPQMSVSVFKVDSLDDIQSGHINDFMYLTSDLRGTVESPGYYFSNDAEVKTAADNLMLTQGWRRFNWSDVLNPTLSYKYVPEYQGHMIFGTTTDLEGNPAPGILAYLSVTGKIINVYTARSNSKGEVVFDIKNFIGSNGVVGYTDSLHRITLNEPFIKEKTTASLPDFTLTPSTEKNLLERAVGMQVQNIYFTDQFRMPKVDSVAFFGSADEIYNLDDYTRFPVMEEVMREYVRGVLVRKQRGSFKFFLLDNVNKQMFRDAPMILLDGIPVFDVDQVMAFDPLRVKKVEVMTRKFFHGNATFFGVLSLSTYKGDLDGFELGPSYANIAYPGLQLQREFYSPRHEFEKDSEMRLPDQRSLLYWNASISSASAGKQDLMFYTSDVPGTYQVVVEGMTADGICGFTTQIFKVTK